MSNQLPGIISTEKAAEIIGVHRNYVTGILKRAGVNPQRVGTAYAWPERAVKRVAIGRKMKALQRKVGGRV